MTTRYASAIRLNQESRASLLWFDRFNRVIQRAVNTHRNEPDWFLRLIERNLISTEKQLIALALKTNDVFVAQRKNMPVISRFLGIIIAMYWDDHLPPHFHARYGEYEITVNILTGVVEGRFPKRSLHHVLEWYELHKEKLMENWELCRRNENPKSIEPLE